MYQTENEKLIQAWAVSKIEPELDQGDEAWYHLVSHNGKHCLMFNCSFQHQGYNLNDYLLPERAGASLLRLPEHAVAINGDIKSMFHQVRLSPEDRCK